MEEQATQMNKRHYKIEEGDTITVYRNDYNGNSFYKVSLMKKNFDGTKSYYSKPVAFKKGVVLEDKTKIKVLGFFEDVRENKNDKYNPIWSLFITEFEEVKQEDAFADFNASVDNSLDYEITDDDLPF